VTVCDPHVAAPTVPLEDAVRGADAVVVATNHSDFGKPATLSAILGLAGPDCLVADPWDTWGAAQVFAYAGELAALAPSRQS
jgi:UDP-N-acetyl-D-mannosaminuronic acid dehydrogenase